jgi:hypothetical protein
MLLSKIRSLLLNSEIMKKYFRNSAALLIGIAVLSFSCKKEEKEDADTDSSKDNAQAESIFTEINEICDQAIEDGTLSTHRTGFPDGSLFTTCASITVTIDSVNGSGSATIDFGNYYCMGPDSKFRKGHLSVSFTGPYKDPGTVITINATDYYAGYDSLNATKVIGERIITNNGPDSLGHLNYSVAVNATLVNYLNEQMNWHSTRNRVWIAGDTSVTRTDDEYLITGSSYGRSFSGVNFNSSVTQALHVKGDCRWITEGAFTLTPTDNPVRTLNYGNGNCDGEATVTIGDKTFDITLR